MDYSINKNSARLIIDGDIYDQEVILNTLYWLTADYSADIEKQNGHYHITLDALENKSDTNWELLITKIKKDLIDYRLRQIVRTETQSIRELIIAKAFAYYDIHTPPVSEVSDPVGFNPNGL